MRSARVTHDRVQLEFDSPSLTKQSSKAECDINNIMVKYAKTGVLNHVSNNQSSYGDFSASLDYQDAINSVMAAQDSFMELPAVVRKKFDNDPVKFLDFVNDPSNVDEMIELGLYPAPEQAPGPVDVAPAEVPPSDPLLADTGA